MGTLQLRVHELRETIEHRGLGFKLASLTKLVKVVKICETRFFYSSLILQLWRIKSKMANLCKKSEIFNSCSSLIPSFPINWCSGNIPQQLCFHFSTIAILWEYLLHSCTFGICFRISPSSSAFIFPPKLYFWNISYIAKLLQYFVHICTFRKSPKQPCLDFSTKAVLLVIFIHMIQLYFFNIPQQPSLHLSTIVVLFENTA